jgi:hypothetical protein
MPGVRITLLRSTLFASAFLGIHAALAVAASQLYANEYPGVTPLFRINQVTNVANPSGLTGQDNVGDLASDPGPRNPRLWGIKINTNTLLQLSPATGATIRSVPLNSPDAMVSLAFDPVTDRLYGNTSAGYGAPFDALYEIDPNTGSSTFVGRIGFENVYALGFTQTGALYGIADTLINRLITISPATGDGTLVTTMARGGYYDLASRPEDNAMFVVDSMTTTVGILDLHTGVILSGGRYVNSTNLVGLAFIMPEPTSLAGLAIAFRLGGRRRR